MSDRPPIPVGSVVFNPAAGAVLTPEQRASLFMDWCAAHGLPTRSWPSGSFNQLVSQFRAAALGD
jgi:hypothetical protein